MFRKILIVYDGSISAKHAYDVALDLANKCIAEFHVVAVVERPPEFAEEAQTEVAVERARDNIQNKFNHLATMTGSAGQQPRFHIKTGYPVEQIVRAAEEYRIDLIVLGHREHGFLERWLTRSISHKVIASSPCAVMVVR